MKFFRLDLLTLLISLFILNSCKNQDAVGLAGNTTGQLSGNLVDTSTIYTHTVYDDVIPTSVTASAASKSPLGLFNDPVFGLTESNIATDIGLPVSYTPPSGTVVIDSALLVLQYADGFYGDSVASNYKINVYQLGERYISGATYYNDKQWKYDPNNLLGSLTFKARTHDSIKVYNIITGKPDTLIKAAPQIRVPINKNFVSSILFNASSTTLGSLTIYQNLVKGMYLTLDKTQTTGPGGILMIKSDTLKVYYRDINGSKIDTLSAKIPVSNFAAQIKHTYPATIQADLADTITPTSKGTIYLQGLAGLRAKISFPNLLLNLRNDLLKNDSDIVINRAEVIVTPQPGTDIPYRPSPKLTMYRLDLAHQRIELEDANTTGDARSFGVGTFGGFYNSTRKEYHFTVTAYLQDLLQNRTTDFGTYIAPVDTTTRSAVDIYATPAAASRVVAGGGADKTSPYRIRLNIIYTKVRK